MKMQKSQWHELCDRVMLALRPTQYPVAMKFIHTQEEFDAINNVEYCSGKATACKVIGMAAHFVGTFGVTTEHFSSYSCATNNGCWPVLEQRFLDGGSVYTPPLAWHIEQKDAILHMAENVKMLPEVPYIGLICSNLADCEVEEPDVIALQLPTQAAFYLLAGYVEADYQKIDFTFSGESNCSDTWMRTLKEGKIGLSLGCRGDRATGGLGYGEVRVTMTAEQLVKALDSIDKLTEVGTTYPFNPTCMLRSAFSE